MRSVILILCVLLAVSSVARAQDDQAASSSEKQTKAESKSGASQEVQQGPRFVRTLTNVQVELTLTDQIGAQQPEKKTVSMIVSSGNWGKIRSAGSVLKPGDPPYGVELNVDARPFVSLEGPISLEITLVYSPSAPDGPDSIKSRTGINQSLTVVLQSGKPLVISQAADPVRDRKVVVEVKATVLK